MKQFATLIGIAAALAVMTSSTLAIDIEVDTFDGAGQVGGFYGPYDETVDAPPGSYPATLDPDNDPSFQNYFMGRSTLGPLTTAITTPERRVFFMFDMAGVFALIPPGESITDVSIDLTLTAGGSAVLANFTDDMEIVDFTGTPFGPDEILDPMGTMTPTDLIWATFGTSEPYGMFAIDGTEAAPGGPPLPDGTLGMPPDTYTIELPGAVPDVETAVLTGEIFIVTARLATFNPDVIGPGAPPAVDPYEYVFGITDVASPTGSSVPAPILTITTAPTEIPEPSSLALLGLSGLLVIRRQRINHSHE